MMADYLALWRAVLIIGVFSYALWKESPYFRLCEHAFLGTAMGYTLVVTIKTIYTTAVYPLVNLHPLFVPIDSPPLALPLFVLWITADHSHHALTFQNLTPITDLFD